MDGLAAKGSAIQFPSGSALENPCEYHVANKNEVT